MNPIKAWLKDARSEPDIRYVDACDGLRALAIMIVGWFHIWQQSWLYPGLTLFGREISLDPLVRSGYIWVDMMILLSGFCHYLPWARRQREGAAQLRAPDFYARRLIRIHPSYLLTLAIMLTVALCTHAYTVPGHLKVDLASHLTYTHMFFYNAYYATNLGGSLWTLAVEMQFYLLFPLLARAFARKPVATFGAMLGASLAFRGYIAAHCADVSMAFNQLPAYLDTFAFGMAAAAIHVSLAGRRRGAASRILCTLLCIPVLMLLWKVVKHQASAGSTEMIRLGQMNHRLAMGMLGAALLLLSANAGLLWRRLLSNPVTRFISSISMQFYIWHQTLAVWILKARLVPSEFENPNWEGDHLWQQRYTLVCFAAALLLSAALTYGFERPVGRRLQGRWNQWRAGRKKDIAQVKKKGVENDAP